MRDYTDRRVTPPKGVSSPTGGIPSPCKQALRPPSAKVETAKHYFFIEGSKLKPKNSISFNFPPSVFFHSCILFAAGRVILRS